MSAVHTIPPTSTGPIRQGLGLPDAFNPPAPLPPDWPVPAEAPPPSDQSPSSSPSSLVAHTSSLPPLTPDQDRLFEALAKGHTSPSELSATLNLPVRQVLNLLATPEITFHLQVLENATDYLARHTTSLRHNLAFKSLEKALTAAAAKDNPAEIRRIATLLLKPTPPLPDPEAEQAERAERITKHRRAVSSLPLPLPAGEGRGGLLSNLILNASPKRQFWNVVAQNQEPDSGLISK